MTEWQKSACILCECNCGIEVQVEDRSLAKIRGDKAHPGSEGYTCEKALRLDHYQSRTVRLTSPLRRTPDGEYEEISWDTAIAEIATRLTAIRDEHGGDKIFFYGGGGQGNHLGATYNKALQGAIGARYQSNALAQEKTGEMYVDGRLYGGHTKGDFEHAEVVVFVGKNPWQSHSFPRARPVLKALAADPERAMVVIDPRRSESAAMADIHLQVRPGTDAWCLAALGAILVQEDLVDHAFIDRHTSGGETIIDTLRAVDVADYAARCGVEEALLRETARRIGAAKSVCTYEDLGIQQAPHSTLSSYLNKLLWILTGNFAKPGAMFLHSSFAPLAGGAPGSGGSRKPKSGLDMLVGTAKDMVSGAVVRLPSVLPDALASRIGAALSPQAAKVARGGPGKPGGPSRRTPVTGARIIAGLVPCNSIAEEILTDHPDRFRAMWIDSVNPAHSLADSASFRAAMRSLDLTVVVDIAMTETAKQADYVLPASSQFEKWECTFFNVDFPRNVFHLRKPVMAPLTGTLSEPEIYARVIRALGVVGESVLAPLRRAARRGRKQYAAAFFLTVGANPKLMPLAPYLLRETLGPTLPEGAEGTASLWGAAQLCALANPASVRRAGFTGSGFEPGDKLFDAVLCGEGVVFTLDDYEHAWDYVRRPDQRFTLDIPELVERTRALADEPSSWVTEEFPFVLSAGERRAFTANTIIRDPGWRRRDRDGALRLSPADADGLGVTTGDTLRVVTERGQADAVVEVSDTMQAGHISLPNGLGLDGGPGVAPNELTSLHHRDWLAGTPWHKYVPARLERIDA
ncbi:Formate dehydrogenase-O, major subunit [Alloactinosynnema sp. L-07]|uniref:molybdopterin-dependent oxidoreductase n=1 Tax=Alloactinosynnema sp. L-07 TaxID=1653480 RepID=UPI00065EF7C1|nr:molybdopterin-dependent oxidoreductase [Alloactinosynnema sp. L-07]CRK56160.1 Formate dehydrogenase-O, major subunit [Alloactinosynnema sp. L-07]